VKSKKTWLLGKKKKGKVGDKIRKERLGMKGQRWRSGKGNAQLPHYENARGLQYQGEFLVVKKEQASNPGAAVCRERIGGRSHRQKSRERKDEGAEIQTEWNGWNSRRPKMNIAINKTR